MKTSLLSDIPLKSSVSGLGWPAIPSAPTATAWALQQQLEESQWWPARVLQEKQLEQLRRVLAHARETVPFYRERDGHLSRARSESTTWDDWRRLPLLAREDVQGAGSALHSNRLPRDHGTTSQITSSGSTGRPVSVLSTQVTNLFWHAFTFREHRWHRRDFRAKLASIRVYGGKARPPHGARLENWGPSTAALVATGPAVALGLSSSLEQQQRWLSRERPKYLLTYPTIAKALAREYLESNTPLPELRELRTIGEALPDDLRQLAKEAWDVPVVDMYSAQEVGYIALQCPEHEHYHVQSENVLVEVLDDAGEPCAPGETGRVVLTGLNNFAMPLLRYAIGDYAEVGPPCDCGRGLPVLARINGRVRNMLRLPGGKTRWPIVGRRMPELERMPVRQVQLVQKSLDVIEANVVVRQPLTQEQEAILIEMWQKSLGHPFEIRIMYPDAIARGAGGKFEEFRSEVP